MKRNALTNDSHARMASGIMAPVPPPRGIIVVLNGPSSAGKTTLARAVRDLRGPNAAALSIDQLYPSIAPAQSVDWPLFRALTEATFAAATAFARASLDVIVDTVFERSECLETARRMLAGHTYYLVAVTCPPEVLEQREMARGDRRRGLARGQHQRVLHGATYDLHIDTHLMSLKTCVDLIAGLLERVG